MRTTCVTAGENKGVNQKSITCHTFGLTARSQHVGLGTARKIPTAATFYRFPGVLPSSFLQMPVHSCHTNRKNNKKTKSVTGMGLREQHSLPQG